MFPPRSIAAFIETAIPSRNGCLTQSGSHVLTQDALRRTPPITQLAFARLLHWIDDGQDSNGERYLEMRSRLVAYFDRRNRRAPDDLADETFNRIARKLEQGSEIMTRPPARYCYIVAKFVLLDDIRRQSREVALDESRLPVTLPPSAGDSREHRAFREQRLECLDRCLNALMQSQRELIVEYYADQRRAGIDRRRSLARRLGISMNALGIRAWRVRDGLRTCIEACRAQP